MIISEETIILEDKILIEVETIIEINVEIGIILINFLDYYFENIIFFNTDKEPLEDDKSNKLMKFLYLIIYFL